MAIKTVDLTRVELNEGKVLTLEAATSASDGFALDFSAQDERTVFIFRNTGSSSATITVKMGDGIQGVTDLDALTVTAGDVAVFRLDSGAFKQCSGANKGKAVFIPSSTDIKAAVIRLP